MHDPTPRPFDARAGRVLADAGRFGRPRGDDSPLLVAHSAPMLTLLRAVERLAPAARCTLVTGPPGSGKSTVAALAFRLGPARSGAQALLSAALDDDERQRMHVAVASGGAYTWVVPELLDLSLADQASLLATLAAQDHLPPGEGLHVLAGSTADPDDALARGHLRADLFYRLSAVRYAVPALADRADDLDELALAGVRSACRRLGVPEKTLTVAALDVLRGRTWPGNVRQLHNVIARAVALTDDRAIGAQTMHEAAEPERLREGTGGIVRRRRGIGSGARGRILAALDNVDGNKSAAAERLGISRRSLYRLLDQLED